MHVLVALTLCAARAAPPTVTIPLEEYEALRKLRERPSVTVVDQLRVTGSFAKRDLAVELAGRAAGTLPTVDVLEGHGYRLFGCQGDALLSRSDSAAFALTPLRNDFRVRCRVALDGSDRLQAEATPAVLEVAASVPDGELVRGDDAPSGRTFSIVRRIEGDGGEALPPSVAGRYRVTLLPEESLFLYRLEVRNPSRSHRRFEVALREAEHVESVNAPVAWDADGPRYRFDLPPGETAIELSGRLTTDAFAPPVEATLQYLLLESHPLIRPDVRTAAKRVGVGEVGLAPRYRGAQAFLLDGDAQLAWTTTRLEALKTAGFAVGDLTQVFFLGADGKARGETHIEIQNQGAPALTLPVTGEPTFASIEDEPVFLTRDAEGRLFLPLGQGAQSVLTQEVQPFTARLGVGLARLELKRPGVAVSREHVELRYPKEWIPVYESLAPVGRLLVLRPSVLLALLILLVLVERVLALGGLGRRARLLLAGSLVLVAALVPKARPVLLALAAAPFVALAAALAWRRLAGWRRALALAAGAFALLLGVFAFGTMSMLRDWEDRGVGSQVEYVEKARLGRAAPEESDQRAEVDMLEPEGVESYEGLPAKIALPAGAHRSHFHREMVAADSSVPVTVLLVSAGAASAAAWAAALLALAVVLRFGRELAEGAERFAARLRGDGAPRAEPGAPAPAA